MGLLGWWRIQNDKVDKVDKFDVYSKIYIPFWGNDVYIFKHKNGQEFLKAKI